MNRVAVVTGAARGIGAATVRRLAAGRLVGGGRRPGRDDPRLPYAMGTTEPAAGGGRPDGRHGDAGRRRGRWRPRGRHRRSRGHGRRGLAEERFGGLDAMVAVAGVIAGGVPLWEMPERRAGTPSSTSTSAVRSPRPGPGSRPCCAGPLPARGGSWPWPRPPPPGACPGWPPTARPRPAWPGWSEAWPPSWPGTGVTANAVSPGSTDTAMLDESARLYGLESAQSFADQQPIERLLDPDEVAATLVWLAGPESSGMTGAVIPVDGGLAL